MSNRRTLPIVALALAVLVGGCFGGGGNPRTFFSLQYPVEDAANAYTGPSWPFSLRIRRLDIKLAYDKQEIVYRTSPYEFQYYWFKLWAAKPQKIVSELLADHLMHSGMVAEVTTKILDRLPDYELAGEILAIEELDAEETWFAHLSMRLQLTRFEDGQVIWQRSFDQRKRVYERQPVFVVKAMSALLEEELRVVTAEIGAKLADEAARRGVAPVARPVLDPTVTAPDGPPVAKPVVPESGPVDSKEPAVDQGPVPKARLKR